MLEIIKNLFGSKSKTDFAQLIKNGATVIDVRSRAEFESGHIPGAINIPVDQMDRNLNKLKDKSKPVITCCASGMRSAVAKQFLVSKGYQAVYNGGGWTNLKSKMQ